MFGIRLVLTFLLPCILFAATGCVSGPMTIHASQIHADNSDRSELTDIQKRRSTGLLVVQGHPNTMVDGLGWVIGAPRKLMLWDSRVDNHAVQPETLAEVATYVEINQLQEVCIRANQYAPIDEWRRLRSNDHISPGWRYTMGSLSVIGYTLLPGRVFGGDKYNPYTNSVYVYSDVPALAIEAAAYAKDIQSREMPGTYAAVNHLPVVSIWRETISTNDTLAYLASHGTTDDHKEGLAILYPNYGAAVGGSFGSLIGATPAFELGGAVVGHISGQHKAAMMDADETTAWLEDYSRGSESSIRFRDDDRKHAVDANILSVARDR
jgi:hypothetical protein